MIDFEKYLKEGQLDRGPNHDHLWFRIERNETTHYQSSTPNFIID